MPYKKYGLKIIKTIAPVIGILLIYNVIYVIHKYGEHQDKLWLHRCNSIEKLYEKHDEYPNVEVDIVFRRNNTFDVTHDRDTTFNLKLKTYLAYMQKEEGKLWLDIKNLTMTNRSAMLSKLDTLMERYNNIDKDRLIIESSCWQALKLFRKNGYYTSFYLTYDKPYQLEEEEINMYMKDLQYIINSKSVNAISFPYWWYSEIKKHINHSIDLLTWEHRKTQSELLFTYKGKEMLEDPQLKVILVKDKGKYHR